MPVITLTSNFIELLSSQKPLVGIVSYFDTEIKGFLLEHRPSGGATFYFRFRNYAGKVRLARIGRLGKINLQEARVRAHQMKQMVEDGGDPKVEAGRFKDVPTFAEFVQTRYMPYAKIKKRSWSTDEIILRLHLLPIFGELRMSRITRSDVVAMHHAAKQNNYAAGTCNRMLILMKFVYNCAIRWDILPADGNPCAGVEPLDDNGARERYLSQTEVQKLFNELDANPNVQVGQVIRLLLYTGARKREILDARWEYIDFVRSLLTVPLSKSGKPRHIPLSDAAVTLLKKLPRRDDIPWVFFNPKTNKPPVSIFYAWSTIRKKVGLQDVRLHDLRHSFASFLVNSGRSLYEVQRLLGHHDPKVTMRYAHLSPAGLLDAVNIVGAVIDLNSEQ